MSVTCISAVGHLRQWIFSEAVQVQCLHAHCLIWQLKMHGTVIGRAGSPVGQADVEAAAGVMLSGLHHSVCSSPYTYWEQRQVT